MQQKSAETTNRGQAAENAVPGYTKNEDGFYVRNLERSKERLTDKRLEDKLISLLQMPAAQT